MPVSYDVRAAFLRANPTQFHLDAGIVLYHGSSLPGEMRVRELFDDTRFFSQNKNYAADYCYNKHMNGLFHNVIVTSVLVRAPCLVRMDTFLFANCSEVSKAYGTSSTDFERRLLVTVASECMEIAFDGFYDHGGDTIILSEPNNILNITNETAMPRTKAEWIRIKETAINGVDPFTII